MQTAINGLRKLGTIGSLAALVAFSGSTSAAPLALPNVPLFLAGSGIEPNLQMAIDDSGSMDYEVLLRGNDGAAWFRRGASGTCSGSADGINSFAGCVSDGDSDEPASATADTKLNFNTAGAPNTSVWRKYAYLFPNGCSSAQDSFRRRLCDSGEHYAIAPFPALAWARSSTYNSAYFDPNVDYKPWVNGGGFTFADAPVTAARFDPVFGAATDAVNLMRDRAGAAQPLTNTCSNANFGAPATETMFRVYTGMVIPSGTCIYVTGYTNSGPGPGGTNTNPLKDTWTAIPTDRTVSGNTTCNTCIPSGVSIGIRYFPATFYLPDGQTPAASRGYNAGTLEGFAPAATTSTLRKYEIKLGNFDTPANYAKALQNFANWFTYYRKRHLALRAGLGQAFDTVKNVRVGGFTINSSDDDKKAVTLTEINDAANRTALYKNFYQTWVDSGGTPNRRAVYFLGENFSSKTKKLMTASCQRNFGMLFTDGFSNPQDVGAPGDDGDNDGFENVDNVDGTEGAPYRDDATNTMADGVLQYYKKNIRDDLKAGDVPVPAACDDTTPNPRLDCNRNPHMNFYAVTLGTRGLLFNPDLTTPADPYTTAPVWQPLSVLRQARHPSAVDDLWHATINGRGKLLNAKKPTDIADKVTEVLADVTKQESSASSAAINSGTVRSDVDERIFQATFNPKGWVGDVIAYKVNDKGETQRNPPFAAEALAKRTTARNIFTVKADGSMADFVWDSLDDQRKLELGATETAQKAVLDYVKGVHTNEGTGTGQFRVRQDPDGKPFVLGDIVSSSPLFIGTPPFRYRDGFEPGAKQLYREFADANDNVADKGTRTPMIYVGANDGMLHAFSAEPLDKLSEVFAFIPSTVFPRLKNLASQNYSHEYFVDGPPAMGDAYWDDKWHTVLVAGLNRGGQGVYALDVTTPDKPQVLWEFKDTDAANLGFTYSQPQIGKLRDGTWVAVFGNGYNNTQSDLHVGTGTAVLYIVNLKTGKVLKQFDTLAGNSTRPSGVTWDNGMSTPALVDQNVDRVVDYIFAGDLFGNMWKFDVNSTDPANWKIAYAGKPIFQARDASDKGQPITVRPEVTRGFDGAGFTVLFGTGKYLESGDAAPSGTPGTFYGIHDANTGSADDIVVRSDLGIQEIATTTVTREKFELRIVNVKKPTTNDGWLLDLVTVGEKQVTNPIVREGRVAFTTLEPSNDPCAGGGNGWLMELDAISGNRVNDTPVFDVDRDGTFDPEKDYAKNDSGTFTQASGIREEDPDNILWSPATLFGETGPGGGGVCVQHKYMPASDGSIVKIDSSCGPGGTGRQSWRQVR